MTVLYRSLAKPTRLVRRRLQAVALFTAAVILLVGNETLPAGADPGAVLPTFLNSFGLGLVLFSGWWGGDEMERQIGLRALGLGALTLFAVAPLTSTGAPAGTLYMATMLWALALIVLPNLIGRFRTGRGRE